MRTVAITVEYDFNPEVHLLNNTGQCKDIAAVLGTMLQAGRSRVLFPRRSLAFSVDLILLASLWPWGRLNL
jgi:hypothetical protein